METTLQTAPHAAAAKLATTQLDGVEVQEIDVAPEDYYRRHSFIARPRRRPNVLACAWGLPDTRTGQLAGLVITALVAAVVAAMGYGAAFACDYPMKPSPLTAWCTAAAFVAVEAAWLGYVAWATAEEEDNSERRAAYFDVWRKRSHAQVPTPKWGARNVLDYSSYFVMAFEQDGRHAVDLIEATPHLRLESRWTQEIDTTPVRRVVLMPDASVADLAVVAADLAVDAAQREQESYYRALEEAAQRAEIAARAAQRSADRDTVQSAHSSD